MSWKILGAQVFKGTPAGGAKGILSGGSWLYSIAGSKISKANMETRSEAAWVGQTEVGKRLYASYLV